jgi:PST family polysaccharide transporter
MQIGSVLQFLSASIRGAKLSATRLVAGFARGKYIAVCFGTTGVALIAQANQLLQLATTIGSLTMAVGIIHGLSSVEVADDPMRRRRLLSTTFTIHLVICAAILLIGVLLAPTVSRLAFGWHQGSGKVLALLLSVPFSALASGHLEGILFGRNRYDLYVGASIVSTIGGVAIFFPLAHYWGVDGAFWAIFAGAVLQFAVFAFSALSLLPAREIFSLGLEVDELRSIIKFCVVIFASSFATYGSSVLLRRVVMGHLGLSAAGIAQVPLAMTAYYTPFLTNPLWGRLHPHVSRLHDGSEARHEAATALVLNTTIGTAFILALICLQETFVRVAYSKEFWAALPLIGIELLGDYFYFIAFLFSVYFLAIARLRVYLVGWMLYYILMLALVFPLLRWVGLIGAPLAYLGANVVAASVALLWFFRAEPGIARTVAAPLITCLVCIVCEILVVRRAPGIPIRLAVPGIYAAWAGALLIKRGAASRQST